MYDALSTPDYFDNYHSLLEDRPLVCGNLKGQRLNKSAFFKDHSDYEVLLRNKIPERYWRYFEAASEDEQEADVDIELGRSNAANTSPQRRSIWSNDGIKETKTDEINLNLGSLKLNKAKTHSDDSLGSSLKLEFDSSAPRDVAKGKKSVDFLTTKINEYKKLPSKTRPADLDSNLESLTNQLVSENSHLKSQNSRLMSKLNAANDIIKYQTSAYETIRSKLKSYVFKYNRANKVIQKLQNSDTTPSDHEEEEDFKSSQIEEIDRQISQLQEQKRNLINDQKRKLELESKLTNSTVVNISLTPELAKIMAQKILNSDPTPEPDHESKVELNIPSKSKGFHPNLKDCPFCQPDVAPTTILNSSALSESQWDALLIHLTDKIQKNSNLNQNGNSNKRAELW